MRLKNVGRLLKNDIDWVEWLDELVGRRPRLPMEEFKVLVLPIVRVRSLRLPPAR